MLEPSNTLVAPWSVAGSAIAGAIVMKVVDWWLSRRRATASDDLVIAKANAEIVLMEVLKTRIEHLETRQADLERRIVEEIKGRLRAMEESSRLRLRVLQLEVALRSHGIDIPAEMAGSHHEEPVGA